MRINFKINLWLWFSFILYFIVFQSPLFGYPLQGSPIMEVNPFLNLLAFALVIERIIEIIILLIPGIEEKKTELEDDPDALEQFKLKIQRFTLIGGMVLGIVGCIIFKFGILDEIFPTGISPTNIFNLIVTGLIAGSGSEPVHQLVLIIIGVRDRLRAIKQTSSN
ncbi:MAG: hypothetical protein ACE5HX_08400 [bacterium]